MRRMLFAATVVLLTVAAPGRSQQLASANDEPLWKNCYTQVQWFHAAEVPNMESRLLELAQSAALATWSSQWIAKAISAAPSLDACKAEAKRQNKLLFWYIPSAEGQHLILPHLLDRYVMTGALADPDVTDLLNRRFVSIKLPVGGALAQATRTAPPAFIEPGVIIFTPDGREAHRIDRIANFDSHWWLDMLTQVLERHGEGTARASEPIRGLEGELRQGLRDRTVDIPALTTKDLEWEGKPRVVAGILMVRSDNLSTALEFLTPMTGDPEGLYWLGVALHLTQRDGEARDVWNRCVQEHPQSPWAAMASAHASTGTDELWGESAFVRGVADPRWMHPEAYRLERDTQWRRDPKDAADIKQRAVEWLLRHQREDGSWSGPRWGGPKKSIDDLHNLRMPIAALCCLALSRHRSVAPKRVDLALERGEGYLLRPENDIARGEGVAWVYGDAYRLLYFAKDRRKSKIKKRVAGWLENLREHQVSIGGSYKHYSYRSTFVTAEVIRVLAAIKKQGVKVPAAMITEASAKLATTRDPNTGFYGYLLDHPHVTRDLNGSGSRQPLCDHAMNLSGAGNFDLTHSIAIFQRSYAGTVGLLRKTNFHSPRIGNVAGYYFFHNFRAACDVAGRHGTAEQRQWMLTALCALPEIDGSFTDSGFSYGKCYGTAQALLCFDALASQR